MGVNPDFTQSWKGKWSDPRVVAAFTERYLAGGDLADVGREFGLTVWSVRDRVKQMGLSRRVSQYQRQPRNDPRTGRDGPALRRCLNCGNNFNSSGFGHRICPSCKNVVSRNSGGFDEMTVTFPQSRSPSITGSR